MTRARTIGVCRCARSLAKRSRGPTRLARPPSIRYKPTVLSSTRTHPVSPIRLRITWTLCSFLALASASCSRKIGDACTTSADCDPSGGTRSCDLSQPGGYCVIEGCDARSCPDDSFCARFYPTGYSSDACTELSACQADEDCVIGSCVRRSLEKRICVQSCEADGDCRGGYKCARTGEEGTIALTLTPGAIAKFCRPNPP
jgi:hypothetical protein